MIIPDWVFLAIVIIILASLLLLSFLSKPKEGA